MKNTYDTFDPERTGTIGKRQFIGFIRKFCAENLDIQINRKQADYMFTALDTNNSGTIERTEVIFMPKPTAEDSEPEDQTFVEKLDDEVDEQVDRYKNFMKKFSLSKENKNSMEPFFEGLAPQMWYSDLKLQQKYLLRSILIKTVQEDLEGEKQQDLIDNPEKVTLHSFLENIDLNVSLLAIVALSPGPFRAGISRDGRLSHDQSWLCDLVETACHEKFIKMISTAVDQAETNDKVGIKDALASLFAKANYPQKRMMLKITNSFNERSDWIQSLEINMI